MNACNPQGNVHHVRKRAPMALRLFPFHYSLISIVLLQDYSEFTFDVQYQPHDYAFILQGGIPTATDLEVFKKNNSSIQHYILKIALKGGGADIISHGVVDEMDQQQKLYYFSYRFQDDISLEENGEVIPCTLFHFERQSDLSGGRTFVLGFENAASSKAPSDRNAQLVIKSPYFSSLPIKIKVSKNNIPSLVL
jgi:hypothetical protein